MQSHCRHLISTCWHAESLHASDMCLLACRIIAGNLFMKPQSILSLRGAADLDKREQVIPFLCPCVHIFPDASLVPDLGK